MTILTFVVIRPVWDHGTTERFAVMTKAHAPITPGEILLIEFVEPLGITQYRLAQATGVSQTRISEIVRGKRSIITETALRLSKALGTDDRFWINIQTDYDLDVQRDLHSDVLAKVTTLVAT
jgi:addiction module HigA family antidote